MSDDNFRTLTTQIRELKDVVEINNDKLSSVEMSQRVVVSQVRVIKEQQSVMNQKMDNLEEGVDGLKNDVDGLKNDVGGLKNDVGGLKTDVGGLKTDMGGLKGQVEEVHETLNNNTSALLELEKTVKGYSDMYKLNNDNMRKLDSRQTRVEQQLGITPLPEESLAEVQ